MRMRTPTRSLISPIHNQFSKANYDLREASAATQNPISKKSGKCGKVVTTCGAIRVSDEHHDAA